MASSSKNTPNVFEDQERVEQSIEDELDREQEEDIIEEVPEAFIPSFTVAPDEIPPSSQVHIPTEDEQKKTLENLYKRVGVKAKEFIAQPTQEITPDKERMLGRVSLMAARIFSSVTMWGFSVLGTEYGIVAPTVEQSYKMLLPMGRVVARHSKFVGNISPDVDDIIESLTAMSDYAVYAMAIMAEIREEKARNNGRYTGYAANAYQARPSQPTGRYNDLRGNTAPGDEHDQNGGAAESVNTRDLDGYQRYNYEMLQSLSARDYASRLRRSGRLR